MTPFLHECEWETNDERGHDNEVDRELSRSAELPFVLHPSLRSRVFARVNHLEGDVSEEVIYRKKDGDGATYKEYFAQTFDVLHTGQRSPPEIVIVKPKPDLIAGIPSFWLTSWRHLGIEHLSILPTTLSIMPPKALPEDLIFFVMTFLDATDIRSTALTCWSFYEIFKSPTIQYIYELQLDGMRDTVSMRSHAELLERLRDRRHAWEKLEWKDIYDVEIPSGLSAYEFVAGAFSRTNGTDFSVHWLPSHTESGHDIAHPSVGISIRDFAIDTTQDLVVFLEENQTSEGIRRMSLHCRTVSTNQIHPHAASGVMSFDIAPHEVYGNEVSAAELQIADDVLILFISTNPENRFLIWNWENGVQLYDSLDENESISDAIEDFNILQRSKLIITGIMNSCGVILIYDFSPTTPGPISLLAILELPFILPNYRVFTVGVHSGPLQRHPTPGTLFTPRSDTHIHTFTLSYIKDMRTGGLLSFKHYLLFVPSSVLLRYCEHDPSEAPSDVQWSTWGEHGSLLIGPRPSFQWLRYAHGPRVVLKSDDGNAIEVLDFSDANLQRAASSRQHDPTVVPVGDVFLDEIVTRLPHRRTVRKVEKDFFAYMIDEERIVGLNSLANTTEMQVFCF
ncbi:hypothetical protein NLJ89_g7880 [Agrocybe chaxingu]|uniref:F-box domain-containing protein n=1 Tax=Agrocybe chaxingu TaxID=84603 RepID=A0A9W8K3I6_9AGAR|nr:hypothetical protein NLJ89_g7880 [Agrocybe chaxingu]